MWPSVHRRHCTHRTRSMAPAHVNGALFDIVHARKYPTYRQNSAVLARRTHCTGSTCTCTQYFHIAPTTGPTAQNLDAVLVRGTHFTGPQCPSRHCHNSCNASRHDVTRKLRYEIYSLSVTPGNLRGVKTDSLPQDTKGISE